MPRHALVSANRSAGSQARATSTACDCRAETGAGRLEADWLDEARTKLRLHASTSKLGAVSAMEDTGDADGGLIDEKLTPRAASGCDMFRR